MEVINNQWTDVSYVYCIFQITTLLNISRSKNKNCGFKDKGNFLQFSVQKKRYRIFLIVIIMF
jgi:hypothetical protein